MPFAVHTGGGGAATRGRVLPALYDGMAMTKLHLRSLSAAKLHEGIHCLQKQEKRQENKLASQQPVFWSKFEARTSKTEARNITI